MNVATLSINMLYGCFPTTVWVDANGVVRAEHFGPLTEDLIERYVDLVNLSDSASN